MILAIVLIVCLALAILAGYIASRPSTFRVVRTAEMPASPDAVFAEVNDLHRWKAWSPWARIDPSSITTYEGPDAGPGAIMRWKGPKTGQGSMTILESRAAGLVRLRLDFLKPFQATNAAEFTFEPTATGTRVTWSMTGTNGFAGKAFGLVMNCDKMCGDMFEKGFANLREVVAPVAVAA